MNRETCYHCEPDPIRREWLDRYRSCKRCKAEDSPPSYDAGKVRAILSGLFPTRLQGIQRQSDVGRLVGRIDVEQALVSLASEKILAPIEANVVVRRFIKQQTVDGVAAAIGCSESTAKRATRSALEKIRNFLNNADSCRLTEKSHEQREQSADNGGNAVIA